MRKNERPASAIATNGHHESPANSTSPSLAGNDVNRSTTSSPLLGTEPLPEEDNSHCPYCHKDFRKPRVLDCLHSMCEDCIIAQLEGRLQQKSAVAEMKAQKSLLDFELEAPKLVERPTPPGVIRCPICAQESHVGNDVRYVQTMLLDYVKVRAAQMDEKSNGNTERRCRACKSEQPAVAMCKQCQSDLCSNCVTAHGVMRMFDEHIVTTYEDIERRGEPPSERPILCALHSQHSKYLCATCELMACKSCLELEHLNHRVIEITDLVIKAIQDDVQSMVEKVEKKYNTTMSDLNSLPDNSSLLHEQHEMAKYRLESYFDDLIKNIEEMKKKKLKELDEARQFQEANIEDIYRKIQVSESRIHDAITFTRRLLERANGIELVASRRKVVQQLGNLSHAIPSHGHQVELEFHPLSRSQIDQHLKSLGGKVVGRIIQPTVKEVAPIGSEVASNRAASQQDDAWGRSTYTAAVQPTPNLGAIGGERKKNNGNGSINGSSRQVTPGEQFGWPPSSNPPESTSPPPQQSVLPLMVGGSSAASVNQQISALPNVTSSGAVQPGAGSIRPELMALAASNLDLSSLNGNQVTMGGTNPALGGNSSLFANMMWSQPGLNGLASTNGMPTTSAPTASQVTAAAFLAQQNQQKLSLQLLLNDPRARGLFNPLMMNQFRNHPSLDQLLSLNLSLGSAAHANSPAAALAAAAAVGADPAAVGASALSQRVSDLKVHSVFGTSQQGSSIRELHCPSGFCLSENDDILIADTNNHRVVVCGPPHPWKIGRPGTDDGQLCFPRKVISLKGESARYVVLDKGGDGKTRAQIFEARGEFVKRINMVAIVPRGGIEVSAACAAPNGQLILVDTAGIVYSIDVDAPRVSFWFDASAQLGEASDVAMFESNIYITDFKHHCVQVFSAKGQFIRKMGEPSQTPYPIGIDVSKAGEVLVADTHGNHLHVVVFSAEGQHQHSFTHNEFRLSRCVGLRIAKSGHIVTLCKHNHTLFVFKPLILPNGTPVPTVVSTTSSILNKFQ